MTIRQPLRDALVVVGTAVLYVACAKLGLALALRAAQVTAVWPPTGFALVATFRFGRPAAVGVLLGAFIANAAVVELPAVAVGIAIGNTLEAVLGVVLLRRAGFDARLARVRDVMALLGALVLAPIVSATIGVLSLGAGAVHPAASLPALWWIWWVGDALGGLILAPALFVWGDRDAIPRRRTHLVEGLLLVTGVLMASALVFVSLPPVAALEYFVFPFLAWAALRFGPPGTAITAVIATAVAVYGTHGGNGPFAGAGPERGLVLLQLFMAVAAVTGLLLGAVAAQNRDTQRRAELSEQRLRMAMTAARIGVWDWNIETGEVLWSEELEPLHGMPSGGFAGTFEAWRALVHPADLPRADAAIRDAREKGVPYQAELRLVGGDGIVRWTDARGQVIPGQMGRAGHLVGVGIDVTHTKELEEKLRREARGKDEFLAMLGHELRNPLAPILHAAELLSDKGGPDAAHAEVIRRQARHLVRLVDDLLDISRISSGKVRLEKRPLILARAIGDAIDTCRQLLESRRQELIVDLPAEAIWLDADPTRLTQIFANLLHNASKFTQEGGRVEITASPADGWVVVQVRDNGTGMSAEVLARAFELFAQGSPALDRPYGGLGLGLTLAQRLVELHGGTIEAASAGENKGSELTIRLPVVEAPVSDQAAVIPAGVTAQTMKRVLVVEDNADARRLITLVLERAGHDVRNAPDGPTALQTAREFAPQVVLLDIGLPLMDGYAVAARIRAMPESASAVLIAVSGYGQPEDQERMRAAGFDDHLLKPVEPAALYAAVGK